ncbi:hypothetical protein KGA66_26165 [Actinocrinis puniceicyclus]|uniref:Secreted protein n=1 Tax=Actinocrinis puniceicyclus TaxID=977794 RepID=A0A8J7WQ99_9ACTN|nr:hypothetical protein [Actinocrinis puniceicyclus]MBS2966551.1 hypothetical protein [Actinocrinis puniceicyclus]
MQLSRKAALLAGSAFVVAALSGGVAYAASAPAVSGAHQATATTAVTDGNQRQGSDTEQQGTESTRETDGPGGHADTPGANVDHQFNGNE